MNAEGQAVAGGVDLVDHLLQAVACKLDDMQDGAENLALQLADRIEPEGGGRYKGSALGIVRQGELKKQAALIPELVAMIKNGLAGVLVDHGSHIGCRVPWITDLQFAGCALQHFQHLRGNILLDVKDAKGRTALAGALEGRLHDVAHRLFGQRGRIDDHRVEAACFGNQRCVRISLRHRHVDQSGRIRAAGKGDTRNVGRTGKYRPDRAALALHQDQGIPWQACRVKLANQEFGNEGCLLGRLGYDSVAGRQCPGDLAGENGRRKIPW